MWNRNVGRAAIAAVCVAALTGCPQETEDAGDTQETEGPAPEQEAFWQNLNELCGNAYPGELVEAPAGDTTFVGRNLVMHVRECDENEVRIPFHVGDDRSRTWVVMRTDEGLRLKHDHRHEDGSEEEITWYGGDAAGSGTETVQEFPADEETVALPVDDVETNVWRLELVPGERFVYALSRHGETRYRVQFDLSREVEPVPPAPWGYEDGEAEVEDRSGEEEPQGAEEGDTADVAADPG